MHRVNETAGDNDHQECYVLTAEWCPDFDFVGDENDAAAADTPANNDWTVNSITGTKKSASASKKRKAHEVSNCDGLVDAVTTFCDSAKATLGELTKKLFVKYDEGERRSTVYDAVGKIQGVNEIDQILIFDRLVENPKKMDLFLSLPDDAKERMVRLMLDCLI